MFIADFNLLHLLRPRKKICHHHKRKKIQKQLNFLHKEKERERERERDFTAMRGVVVIVIVIVFVRVKGVQGKHTEQNESFGGMGKWKMRSKRGT